MIRKYKAFSLALMALCAFGAFAVQSASANPFTVEGIPSGSTVFITGTNESGTNHTFTTNGNNVVCKHSLYSASAKVKEGAVENGEITLKPEYTECNAFGFATTDVKVNGCTYTLTTPTKVVAGEVTWHPSQIHILCPVGKKIEITPTSFGVSVCTQSVGEQTPTEGHIVARNVPGSNPMHVTDEATVKGVHYTGTGGACGTSGTTSEYQGKTTVKCYSNEAHTVQVGCTFS